LLSPRLAAFDPLLSGTKLREARGASRGNACLGSKNAVSLSSRFGLQSMGCFSLVLVQPRHQNLRRDGESSGAHSIARQLVRWTPLPLPANASERKSTWATPKNAKGFRACQSPPPAAADFFYSLLAASRRRSGRPRPWNAPRSSEHRLLYGTIRLPFSKTASSWKGRARSVLSKMITTGNALIARSRLARVR